MNYGLLTPVDILTAASLLVMVGDIFLPKDYKPSLAAFAAFGVAVTLGAVLKQFFVGRQGSIWSYSVGHFNLYFQIVFLLGTLLTIGSSIYFLRRGREAGEYFSLLLLATLGAMLLVSSANLLTIYVSLELLSISSYALVAFRRDARSGEGALKYFLLGGMSSAVFLYGTSLLYGLSGSLDLRLINLHYPPAGNAHLLFLAAMFLLVVAFGFKVALVPFHMWAPDTYEGAPTPVTAYLSAVSKAAAFAVLLRVLITAFPAAAPWWRETFAILSVATMTLGNLAALRQNNLKRMLAYSSIAQAGYVLIALAVPTAATLSASLFYLMAYTFMNIGAFAVLAYTDAVTGKEDVESVAGLGLSLPWAGLCLTVFLLSLGGLPFTAGLMGKFFLFYGAVAGGSVWLAAVALGNSVLSFFYYFRVIRYLYWVPAKETHKWPSVWPWGLTVGTAALVTLFLGVYPAPLLALARMSLPVIP